MRKKTAVRLRELTEKCPHPQVRLSGSFGGRARGAPAPAAPKASWPPDPTRSRARASNQTHCLPWTLRYLWELSPDLLLCIQRPALGLNSTADLRCMQFTVNSWKLNAPNYMLLNSALVPISAYIILRCMLICTL